MFGIERLEWDSSFFGFEVGRIGIGDEKEFDYKLFSEYSKKFKLVYVFSKVNLLFPNFELVDRKVVLNQFTYEVVLKENELVIDSFNLDRHDIKELKQLALKSGIYSRFNVDQNFTNNEFEKLYIQWIENAVNHEVTFDIIVVLKNTAIIGFVTLNKKNEFLAEIGLLAVSENFRGCGIGQQLISESIKRSYNAGFKEIQVVTQQENIPAMNLYQKTNFKIKEINNIYHSWNL
ncbi:GNAT family N-acetyltransferase [Flavobacterium agrisoli]|uniref:GNAT family N-acetyltransferase n=1 Tax=Flavobacterium agrisoli TaxID=2793066 RepID=A0A934PQ49_9FLAO|nr:GNAT family N-acetyltransferase [Flavobacterium agrisoli]MBK0371274.1 GNAT family N-acetyltransferase [Flavobacterium agrisoli]